MDDAFTPNQAPTNRPSSRRVVLWEELERLHEALGLPPPTETYTVERLEEVVELRRQELAKVRR